MRILGKIRSFFSVVGSRSLIFFTGETSPAIPFSAGLFVKARRAVLPLQLPVPRLSVEDSVCLNAKVSV